MRGRKYIVVTVLSWAILFLLAGYFLFENTRTQMAEAEHTAKLVGRGAEIYAENCVICHGPNGEGVVGPTLNRDAWKGDPAKEKDKYDTLYKTVANGRPGTTDPRWERLVTGQWASHTAMPTWGAQNGGPLNEQALRSVVTFIMTGDWSEVSNHIPDAKLPEDNESYLAKMPDGVGLTPAESRRGKELFRDKGCISCHTIGSFGGGIGPQLSKVGSWGVDAQFLTNWIANPTVVSKKGLRMPVYFSNYGGPLPYAKWVGDSKGDGYNASPKAAENAPSAGDQQTETNGEKMAGGALPPDIAIPNATPYNDTIMPALPMTDQERAALVKYLMSLK